MHPLVIQEISSYMRYASPFLFPSKQAYYKYTRTHNMYYNGDILI